jgi:hypothetical protein
MEHFFFGTNSILHVSNLHRKLSVQYVYKIEMKWTKRKGFYFNDKVNISCIQRQMTNRLALKRGTNILHSESADKRDCGICYTFVGQVGGWVVKKGRRSDSYIFMATTEHDDILWLTTLGNPCITDCAWQQLGIILIKNYNLPTLQSPGTCGAICYTNIYSYVPFISSPPPPKSLRLYCYYRCENGSD